MQATLDHAPDRRPFKMKKIVKIIIVVPVAIARVFVLLFALGLFMMSRPTTEVVHASTAREYAERTGRTNYFPATSSNIWYAWASVGMGGRAHIFRFEAPLADCQNFAKREFNHYVKQLYDNPTNYPPDDLVPLAEMPEDPRPRLIEYGLKKLDWFDYRVVTNGLTITRPRSHLPVLWIDMDRSTLYSYWTD